ncbi:MAG: YggS family pyridoxal phosphate-dependent enzyme [candidate division Zixibacteria bacterium]|nr:YggS family pyridoxal phosphate-dependent enzyme [candidate division Zixibacteria bacterium]
MQELYRSQIQANLQAVNKKITNAATRSGRNPEDITLVTVSKTFPSDVTKAAVDAGAFVLGESRVQEGCQKIDELGRIAAWHMIGHLQTNKAHKAVEYFDLIHSIDSEPLSEKISQAALKQNKTINCLIEVNSSGEDSKFGFSSAEIVISAGRIAELKGINLCGLMTIGPWTTNEGCVKKAFELTRGLYEKLQDEIGPGFNILSMGMSSDYELAIACGSTMVRVGTAIFGDRKKLENLK